MFSSIKNGSSTSDPEYTLAHNDAEWAGSIICQRLFEADWAKTGADVWNGIMFVVFSAPKFDMAQVSFTSANKCMVGEISAYADPYPDDPDDFIEDGLTVEGMEYEILMRSFSNMGWRPDEIALGETSSNPWGRSHGFAAESWNEGPNQLMLHGFGMLMASPSQMLFVNRRMIVERGHRLILKSYDGCCSLILCHALVVIDGLPFSRDNALELISKLEPICGKENADGMRLRVVV